MQADCCMGTRSDKIYYCERAAFLRMMLKDPMLQDQRAACDAAGE